MDGARKSTSCVDLCSGSRGCIRSPNDAGSLRQSARTSSEAASRLLLSLVTDGVATRWESVLRQRKVSAKDASSDCPQLCHQRLHELLGIRVPRVDLQGLLHQSVGFLVVPRLLGQQRAIVERLPQVALALLEHAQVHAALRVVVVHRNRHLQRLRCGAHVADAETQLRDVVPYVAHLLVARQVERSVERPHRHVVLTGVEAAEPQIAPQLRRVHAKLQKAAIEPDRELRLIGVEVVRGDARDRFDVRGIDLQRALVVRERLLGVEQPIVDPGRGEMQLLLRGKHRDALPQPLHCAVGLIELDEDLEELQIGDRHLLIGQARLQLALGVAKEAELLRGGRARGAQLERLPRVVLPHQQVVLQRPGQGAPARKLLQIDSVHVDELLPGRLQARRAQANLPSQRSHRPCGARPVPLEGLADVAALHSRRRRPRPLKAGQGPARAPLQAGARAGDVGEAILVKQHFSDTVLLQLRLVEVVLLGESPALQQPGRGVPRRLRQDFAAHGDGLIETLAAEVASRAPQGIHGVKSHPAPPAASRCLQMAGDGHLAGVTLPEAREIQISRRPFAVVLVSVRTQTEEAFPTLNFDVGLRLADSGIVLENRD
eukprot:scaffold2963_cov250-Pinguiococcus_pyrenoidosus.AAC.2